ncbi:MAG: hypothetical protein ACRDYX_14650 [Egibacteraceae bacterium]
MRTVDASGLSTDELDRDRPLLAGGEPPVGGTDLAARQPLRPEHVKPRLLGDVPPSSGA